MAGVSLQDWYQKMSEDSANMDAANQEDFVKSHAESLPEGVRLAVVLDSMGFNMDRVQEDGSYVVSGNDLAFGEGQALGIFSESGELDTGKAMDLLETNYDDMSADQKQALDNVTFVNQNVLNFARTKDGQLLSDTEDGQQLGDFLEKIDGVDDLQEYQDGNFFSQKKTAADIVSGAMKNQDTLADATITLDADTMAQFSQYRETMALAQSGQLTSDFLSERVGVGKQQESDVEGLSEDSNGVVKDASTDLDAAVEGAETGADIGAGGNANGLPSDLKEFAEKVGKAGLGFGGAAAGAKLGDILSDDKVREHVDNLKEGIRESWNDLKENVSELQGMGVSGATVSPGGMDGLVEDISGLGSQMDGLQVPDDPGLESDAGLAEPVEGEIVEPDVPQGGAGMSYNNQGDTHITINIGSDANMSMLDMARKQMEDMGIDMSDEANPEIPSWYGEMQDWMVEKGAEHCLPPAATKLPYTGGQPKSLTLEMPAAMPEPSLMNGVQKENGGTNLTRDDKVKMAEDHFSGISEGASTQFQSGGMEV